MEQQEKDRIFFMDSIRDFDVREHPQSVIHILCTRGSMSFRFQNVNYNIVAGDYVILTNMSLASGFSESDDYSALTMGLSAQFVMSMAIRNNYGIIGHLSLLQNPVMKLSPHDFRKCVCDMERLRQAELLVLFLFQQVCIQAFRHFPQCLQGVIKPSALK